MLCGFCRRVASVTCVNGFCRRVVVFCARIGGMSYEYITEYSSPNFKAGRPAGKPAFIVIHHWGSDGQKFEDVVNYLCRKGGNTSAHYVVEAGRVACIVDPDDRAWHAGSEGNPRGIGVECRPEMSDDDLETVAELIADLRKAYGDLPLYPHKKFVATACPGRYDGRLEWLSRRAEELRGKKPLPAKSSAVCGGAVPLVVDGHMGKLTVAALQRFLKSKKLYGGVIDGVLSNQSHLTFKTFFPAVTSVTFGGVSGSMTVRGIQRLTGAKVDGFAGKETATKLQQWLVRTDKAGISVDGVFGERSTKALQNYLNKGGWYR